MGQVAKQKKVSWWQIIGVVLLIYYLFHWVFGSPSIEEYYAEMDKWTEKQTEVSEECAQEAMQNLLNSNVTAEEEWDEMYLEQLKHCNDMREEAFNMLEDIEPPEDEMIKKVHENLVDVERRILEEYLSREDTPLDETSQEMMDRMEQLEEESIKAHSDYWDARSVKLGDGSYMDP